jgi:hypothetical protein
MWPFKKKKRPTFKIEIYTGNIVTTRKYILRKAVPYDRWDDYEMLGQYETYEEAVAAIEHYLEFPQYFDKNGKRFGIS